MFKNKLNLGVIYVIINMYDDMKVMIYESSCSRGRLRARR